MKILIVEDDKAIAALLTIYLSEHHEVKVARTVAEALTNLQSFRPGLLLLDYFLDGPADPLFTHIPEQTKAILITASPKDARNPLILPILEKPFSLIQLQTIIDSV